MTVCDPSYTDYSSIPDLSIYDGNPGIRSYITQGNMEDSVDGYLNRRKKTGTTTFSAVGSCKRRLSGCIACFRSSGNTMTSMQSFLILATRKSPVFPLRRE